MPALGAGADLALQWRGTAVSRAGFDLSGGTLPVGAALARASLGYGHDAGGVLTAVSADVARFDHDPVSGAARGLLIEPAATNSFLRSQAFDDAAWSKADLTIATDAAAAPDGSTTAEKLVETATVAPHYVYQVGLPDSGEASVSVYARAAERNWFWLYGSTGANAVAYFNLAAGVAGSIAGAGAIASTIEPAGGGWFRCTFQCNAVSGAAGLGLATGDGVVAYAGDGASGIWFWQADMVADAPPGSPIATLDAPVTRAADLLSLDWGGLGIADGVHMIRYRFDDGSSQWVATTIAGGVGMVPGDLARRHVRTATL